MDYGCVDSARNIVILQGILYCQTTWQIDTSELDEECQWQSDGLSNLFGRDPKLFVLHGIVMYIVVYIYIFFFIHIFNLYFEVLFLHNEVYFYERMDGKVISI